MESPKSRLTRGLPTQAEFQPQDAWGEMAVLSPPDGHWRLWVVHAEKAALSLEPTEGTGVGRRSVLVDSKLESSSHLSKASPLLRTAGG